MIHKLLENILSFGYKVPKDPEKLLYDFYFLVGYVYGNEGKILKEVSDEDGEQKAMAFVLQEAVNDCVNNLQGHMLRALKWSLSAEFRHTFDKTSSRYWEKELTPDAFKFLKIFREKYNALSDDYYRVFNPGRKQAKLASDEIASAPDIQNRYSVMSGRNATYMDSYLALQSTQKQLGYTEDQFSDVLISVYDDISWAGSYGGKNWAKIAKAYKKLLAANTLPMKIVYIDHAYDLQHNTGSVFTKVKAYYKEGSSNLNWLAKALDWKRDAQDIRDYFDRVSLGLQPLVGWVAKKFGLTVEERFPFGKEDTSVKKPPVEKKSSSSLLKSSSLLGSKIIYIQISSPEKEADLMSYLDDKGYVEHTQGKALPSMGFWETKGNYILKLYPPTKTFKILSGYISTKHAAIKTGHPYINSAKEFLDQIIIPDTTKLVTSDLKVGDVVKLIVPAQYEPKYGWGSTSSGDIGEIIHIKKEGIVVVKFPKHLAWNGLASELEKVERENPEEDFKIGDVVKVKKGNKTNGDLAFISSMKHYEGKSAVVTKKSTSGKVEIDIDGGDYWWDPSWLEKDDSSKPSSKFKIGDIVKIKTGNRTVKDGPHSLVFVSEMKQYEGSTDSISSYAPGESKKFKLASAPWTWHEDWLEKVERESPVEFKVGDSIKIKMGNHSIGDLGYPPEMRTYEGEYATITKKGSEGNFEIDIDEGDYWWHPTWLEKVKEDPSSKSSKPNFTESWTVKCGAKGSVKLVLLALEHQNSKFPGIKWSAGESPTGYTPSEPCFIYIRPAREKPSGYEITTGSIHSKSTATHVVDADDFVKFIK
jgi:uncharacterized protein YodC (DUF2158 family)